MYQGSDRSRYDIKAYNLRLVNSGVIVSALLVRLNICVYAQLVCNHSPYAYILELCNVRVSRYNDNAKHSALVIHVITRNNVNNALYTNNVNIWLCDGALML
jgi:hypothetical protein